MRTHNICCYEEIRIRSSQIDLPRAMAESVTLHIEVNVMRCNARDILRNAMSNILRILPPFFFPCFVFAFFFFFFFFLFFFFQMKHSGSFHISAQNIDCVYLLEPPVRGGSNEYAQSIS